MKKVLLAISLLAVVAILFSLCVLAQDAVDNDSENVTLTVLDGEETKDVVVSVSVLYTMSGTSITGVNAITDDEGNEYKIVKLVIPSSVTAVNTSAINGLSSLTQIAVEDGASITFAEKSILNCGALELLTFGECSVVFNKNVMDSCPLLATIDVTRADAKFNSYAFYEETALKALNMASGHTYSFGEYSLGRSGLTQVILPDNSTVTLARKCFAETQSIEYIYIGTGCIPNKKIEAASCFDGNSYLSKVVAMDIVYFGQWAFSAKAAGQTYGPKCPLTFYHHGDSALGFHNEAFNNRTGSNPVYFYTTATEINSYPSTSTYTFYKGIGHNYTLETLTESTCTTQGTQGYVTDCSCGEDYRDNSYEIIAKGADAVPIEAFGTQLVYLPLSQEHTMSDIVCSVVFENGLTQLGTKSFKCLYCEETVDTEGEPSFPAIFNYYGYSHSNYGPVSIAQCFGINSKAYDEYVAITGNTVSYGLMAAAKATVGEKTDLIDKNGNGTVDGVVIVPSSLLTQKVFEMKIVGLDDYKGEELYCCAYYIFNEKVYYINEGAAVGEAPVAITYNQIAE